MSLRARLTLAAATAVAVAVVLAAGYSYVSVRDTLRGQVDERLQDQAGRVNDVRSFGQLAGPRPASPLVGEEPMVQLVGADGSTSRPETQRGRLPVDASDRAVAAGRAKQHFRDATVLGEHVRVVTLPVTPGVAVQVTRSLAEVDRNLSDLRVRLVLAGLGGVALAAALGLLVARSALRPVRRLTRAAEHVAATQDLSASIEVHGRDEVGRLADSFNEMLGALEQSRVQQRQLVADAGHELRTPLTSLRTNIEVLASQAAMPAHDRECLLADAVAQLEELTVLVSDLVELAREDHSPGDDELADVRLDDVVEHAVDRARLHAPELTIHLRENTPAITRGNRPLLERAVANIMGNACKWSPPGGTIDVAFVDGELTVRDHGPGIEPEDLPHVFDRFYRAPAARSMPGSGLGLAIVRNAALAHGGTVTAVAAPGGGTELRLSLPIEATPGDEIDDGMHHDDEMAVVEAVPSPPR